MVSSPYLERRYQIYRNVESFTKVLYERTLLQLRPVKNSRLREIQYENGARVFFSESQIPIDCDRKDKLIKQLNQLKKLELTIPDIPTTDGKGLVN